MSKNPDPKQEIQSPKSATTARQSDEATPDANVDIEGHCTLTETAEQDRPDTGLPCDDGRDAK